MVKKSLSLCIILITIIVLIASVHAASNESVTTLNAIEKAKSDIAEMQSKNIPISRANESLSNAIALYNAQFSLEEKNRTADFKLALSYAQATSQIKDTAVKANDELTVFETTYQEAKQDTNLSEMDELYTQIHESYKEERFEDTLTLINEGYTKISDIQAKQTSLRLFYDSTSNNIKKFFTTNWTLLISEKFYTSAYFYLIILLIVLVASWTAIKKLNVRKKIKHLALEKETLNSLLKKLQSDYFKSRKISETEYKVKTERFKEMIRDIDRQTPLLREKLAKLDKTEIKLKKSK